MGRPKAKGRSAQPRPERAEHRYEPTPAREKGKITLFPTLIHLKASNRDQLDWLELARRKSLLSKSAICRLGLALWAETNGYPPFPMGDDDDEVPATGR